MKHKAFCHDHFGGSVEGLSLLDLMQMLHWSRATSIIFINTEYLSGKIHFFDGEVVHAETANNTGTSAFYEFVQQDHGLFRLKTVTAKPKNITIREPFKKLTLDAVQYFDEKLRDKSSLGQVAPFQPISKNEASVATPTNGGVVQPFPDRPRSLHCLDDLCETVIERESDILACSVIGLENGIPLGVFQKMHSITPVSYVNALVDNVLSLFRSEHLNQMDVVLTGDGNWDDDAGLEELYFRVGSLGHFMKAIPNKNAVLVLAMKHTVNQALGWVTLRRALPLVEDALS